MTWTPSNTLEAELSTKVSSLTSVTVSFQLPVVGVHSQNNDKCVAVLLISDCTVQETKRCPSVSLEWDLIFYMFSLRQRLTKSIASVLSFLATAIYKWQKNCLTKKRKRNLLCCLFLPPKGGEGGKFLEKRRSTVRFCMNVWRLMWKEMSSQLWVTFHSSKSTKTNNQRYWK